MAWEPHPGPQRQFLSSQAFEVLYGGARGGGKTDCLLYGALRQVHQPGYRALILRRTFPELREVMDRAHLVFPATGGTWVASEKLYKWPNGAKVEFGYCENYQDALQFQGQEFQYIGYDEIGNLADERAWDFLLTCIRSTNPQIVKMARASANPGGAAHGWLKRRFITPCPPGGTPVFTKSGRSRAFVQARVWDNPSLAQNDPDYVRTLQDLPAVMRAQHLDGDWSVGTGLAFPTVTEESHLVRTDGLVWGHPFGAFDWGFGHKWAFGLFGSGLGGQIVLRDSVMGRGHIPAAIVDRVRDLLDLHGLRFLDLQYTVAGSDVKIRDEARGANGPSVMEQFVAHGWYLMNADQSRVAGFQQCLHYLEHPTGHPEQRLVIVDTPGNRVGTRQLTELVTDPDYPNDVLKVDVDPMTGEGGDDWYDMLRYGLMTRPRALAIQSVTSRSLDRHVPRKTEPDRWAPTSLPRTHPQQLARRSTKID